MSDFTKFPVRNLEIAAHASRKYELDEAKMRTQELEARILALEDDNKRLRLGIKASSDWAQTLLQEPPPKEIKKDVRHRPTNLAMIQKCEAEWQAPQSKRKREEENEPKRQDAAGEEKSQKMIKREDEDSGGKS
ncbi:MAG: hypothetical protein Q9218_007092 [Villophora microphyllina]